MAMKPVWTKFENQVGKDNITAVQQCNVMLKTKKMIQQFVQNELCHL